MVGSIPYHTRETVGSFSEATNFFLGKNKEIKIDVLDFQLSRDRIKDNNEWFITKEAHKVHFNNASSGMKSLAIMEPIIQFYAQFYDMQDSLNKFILSIANDKNISSVDIILDMFLNISKANTSQDYGQRISLFIEEPEISLFPNAQKKLIESLVDTCFNVGRKAQKREVCIAFSTHSPYMLSSLNCLLLAYEVGKKSHLKEQVEKIISKNFWLDISKFNAFKVENGKVKSIIDKETNLILADKIDEVSEEIATTFDNLLDLQYK